MFQEILASFANKNVSPLPAKNQTNHTVQSANQKFKALLLYFRPPPVRACSQAGTTSFLSMSCLNMTLSARNQLSRQAAPTKVTFSKSALTCCKLPAMAASCSGVSPFSFTCFCCNVAKEIIEKEQRMCDQHLKWGLEC